MVTAATFCAVAWSDVVIVKSTTGAACIRRRRELVIATALSGIEFAVAMAVLSWEIVTVTIPGTEMIIPEIITSGGMVKREVTTSVYEVTVMVASGRTTAIMSLVHDATSTTPLKATLETTTAIGSDATAVPPGHDSNSCSHEIRLVLPPSPAPSGTTESIAEEGTLGAVRSAGGSGGVLKSPLGSKPRS
jgi:hypothetical protein